MAEDDNVSATDNPWLRDDNRYTFDTISSMSRPEFDRRRELHLIYGTDDPDKEIPTGEWGARALRDTNSLEDYIQQNYDPDVIIDPFAEQPREALHHDCVRLAPLRRG